MLYSRTSTIFLIIVNSLLLKITNSKSISASYLLTKNPEYKFNSRWTIENYLHLPYKGDESLFSPPIESLDANCPIKLRMELKHGINGGSYPGITRVYPKLHALPTNVKEVLVNCEVAIVDSKGQRTNFTKKFDPSKSLFSSTDNPYGYVPFITKAELEDNKAQILPDGHLTLEIVATATVQWNNGLVNNPQIVISLVEFENQFPQETLQQMNLFGDTSTDMVVLSGDKRFSCHKNIVAHRSPYLRSLVSEHDPKSGDVIEIDVSRDMSELELNDFLAFIYTGHAPNLLTTCDSLYAVAEKYGVPQLRKLCESVFMVNLLANGKHSLEM